MPTTRSGALHTVAVGPQDRGIRRADVPDGSAACNAGCNEIVAADERVVALAGAYGSGKTEVAVHLALALAAAGRTVQVADLDLVNPYFRCREARALMERAGIRVVVPPGAQAWADLPILLPEIRGMLHPPEGVVTILDVGGDDVGARALASFRGDLAEGDYQLWQVLNRHRPFTGTVDGCLALRADVERGSRLGVTGFVSNAHLLDETSVATVLDGWTLARDVAAASGLPVRAVAVPAALAGDPALAAVAAPLLPIRRLMVPPWLARADAAPPKGIHQHGTHRD